MTTRLPKQIIVGLYIFWSHQKKPFLTSIPPGDLDAGNWCSERVKVCSDTYSSVICGNAWNDEHEVECYDELDDESLHVRTGWLGASKLIVPPGE